MIEDPGVQRWLAEKSGRRSKFLKLVRDNEISHIKVKEILDCSEYQMVNVVSYAWRVKDEWYDDATLKVKQHISCIM